MSAKDERHALLTAAYRAGVKLRGLGVPWFTAESWPLMRAAAADRDNLPEEFAEFERLASDRFDDLVARGHPAERVVFTVEHVEKLIAMCKAANKPLDARTRAVFASWLLSKRDEHAGSA